MRECVHGDDAAVHMGIGQHPADSRLGVFQLFVDQAFEASLLVAGQDLHGNGAYPLFPGLFDQRFEGFPLQMIVNKEGHIIKIQFQKLRKDFLGDMGGKACKPNLAVFLELGISGQDIFILQQGGIRDIVKESEIDVIGLEPC